MKCTGIRVRCVGVCGQSRSSTIMFTMSSDRVVFLGAFLLVFLSLTSAAVKDSKPGRWHLDSQKREKNIPIGKGSETKGEDVIKELKGIFDDSKTEEIEIAFGNFGKSVQALGEQMKSGFDKLAKKYNLTNLSLPEMLKINQKDIEALNDKLEKEATGAIQTAKNAVKDTQAIVKETKNEAENAVKEAELAEQNIKASIDKLQKPIAVNRASRYQKLSEREEPKTKDKIDTEPQVHKPKEETWDKVMAKVDAIKVNLDPLKAKDSLKKIEEAIKLTRERLEKAMEKLKIDIPKMPSTPDEGSSRRKRSAETDTDQFKDFLTSLKDAFGDGKLDAAFENVQTSLEDIGKKIGENGDIVNKHIDKLKEILKGSNEEKVHRRKRDVSKSSNLVSVEDEEASKIEEAVENLKNTFDPDNIEAKFDKVRDAMKEAEQEINRKFDELKEIFKKKDESLVKDKRGAEKEQGDDKIEQIIEDFKHISEDIQAKDIKDAFVEFGEKIKKIGERFEEGMKKLFHDMADDKEGEMKETDKPAPKKSDSPTSRRKRDVDHIEKSNDIGSKLEEIKHSLNDDHLDDCFKQLVELLKVLKNKIQSNIEKMDDTVEIRELREAKSNSAEQTELAKNWEEFKQEFNQKEIEATFEEIINQLSKLKDHIIARAKHLENDLSSLEDNEPKVKRYLSKSGEKKDEVDKGLDKLKEQFDHDHVEKVFKDLDAAIMKANEDIDSGMKHFRDWLKTSRRQFKMRSLREMKSQPEVNSENSVTLDEAEKKIAKLFENISPEQLEKPFLSLKKQVEEITSRLENTIQDVKKEMESEWDQMVKTESPKSEAKKVDTPANKISTHGDSKVEKPATHARNRREAKEQTDAFPDDVLELFDDIEKEIPAKDIEDGIKGVQERLKKLCSTLKSIVKKIIEAIKSENLKKNVARRGNTDTNVLDELSKEMDKSFDEKEVEAKFQSLWKSLERIVQKMKDGTTELEKIFKDKENHQGEVGRTERELGSEEEEKLKEVEEGLIDVLKKIKAALSPEKMKERFDKLNEIIDSAKAKAEKEIDDFNQFINETHVAEEHKDGRQPKSILVKKESVEEEGEKEEKTMEAAFDDVSERLASIVDILKKCFDEIRKDLGKEIKEVKSRGNGDDDKMEHETKFEDLDEVKEFNPEKIKELFDILRKESIRVENKINAAVEGLKKYFADLEKEDFSATGKGGIQKRSEVEKHDDLEEKVYKKLNEMFDGDKIKEAFTELYNAMSKAQKIVEDSLKNSQEDAEYVLDKETVLRSMLVAQAKRKSDSSTKPSSEAKTVFKDLMNALKKFKSKFNPKEIKNAFNEFHKDINEIEGEVDEGVDDFTEWIEDVTHKEQEQPPQKDAVPKSKRDSQDGVIPESDDEIRLKDLVEALDKKNIQKFNAVLKTMLSEGKTLSESLQRFVAKIRMPPLPEPIVIKPLEGVEPLQVEPGNPSKPK